MIKDLLDPKCILGYHHLLAMLRLSLFKMSKHDSKDNIKFYLSFYFLWLYSITRDLLHEVAVAINHPDHLLQKSSAQGHAKWIIDGFNPEHIFTLGEINLSIKGWIHTIKKKIKIDSQFQKI